MNYNFVMDGDFQRRFYVVLIKQAICTVLVLLEITVENTYCSDYFQSVFLVFSIDA